MKTTEKLLLIWKFILLFIQRKISLKYILKYDYSKERYIEIMANRIEEVPQRKLFFNKDLQLVGPDCYKVVNTDDVLVNKEIKNPKHKGVYRYNTLFCDFEFLMSL